MRSIFVERLKRRVDSVLVIGDNTLWLFKDAEAFEGDKIQIERPMIDTAPYAQRLSDAQLGFIAGRLSFDRQRQRVVFGFFDASPPGSLLERGMIPNDDDLRELKDAGLKTLLVVRRGDCTDPFPGGGRIIDIKG